MDKIKIAKNFSRAAKNYDKLAIIQKSAAKKLITLTSPFIKTDSQILDLGSGTGFIAKQILKQVRHNEARSTKHEAQIKISETDLSLEMLNSWHNRPSNITPIQADIENLPFKLDSFDIIFSSFSLQWLCDFKKNFRNFSSLLKSKGILAFCLPLDGSLKELRAAKIFHFNQLPQKKQIELSLKNSGFKKEKTVAEITTQKFSTGYEALKFLKEIGANYSSSSKPITKTRLKHFDNFCLKNSSHKNSFAISWNIAYFIYSKND